MSNLLRAEAGTALNSPALNSPALTSLALTLLGLVGLSLPAAAQAPAGYYGSVDTSSAAALRSTLHAVIDDHQRFPYTSSSTDTWDILEDAEQQAGSSGNVLTFYSNASYTKQGGGNSFYNREHLWPTSFGFPNDNSSNYPFSDCHLLRLTDDGYNSARGNKPFRNCDPGCGEYTTSSNNGAGGGSGVYPGQSNWVSGFGATGTWEVWSDRKGDAARAILYADVRYEGGNHGSTGVSEPDLVATNDQGLISGSNTGSNESVAYMGLLDVLLAWHAADPVDQKERDRNDVVFSYQGNRNPFVDHPEWVDLLYTDTPITSQPWMNELHYDNDGADVGEFVEIAGPAGLDLAGYRVVAYNGSNGTEYDAITLSGQIPDQGNCLGALSFAFPNLQNGAPDGLCLVDPLDDVIEFLSYEGVVVATDGPAFGTSSVDMGVSESSLTPAGQSLQRIGSGTQALDFTWTGPVTESPGSVNNGQTFEDACGGTTPPPPPTGLGGSSCAGLAFLDWNPSSDPSTTGYRLWRSNTIGSGYTPLFVAPITQTSYTDDTAAGGSTAYYAITAVSPAGESALSNPLAITIQGGGALGQPWINEFHYDNSGTDTGEFFEIAGPSGLSLSGWTLYGYNGANGLVYTQIALSGTLPDGPECVGAASFAFTGMQNGAPDGLALVDPGGAVVEFLSYEGSLTAQDGPAQGQSSVDVGIAENSLTPIGSSLQRVGTGASAADFGTWTGPIPETPGAANTGQSFLGGCADAFVAVGCGVNPSDSLVLLSGQPELGGSLEVGIDNPLGTQTVGSLTFLLISAAPGIGAPCGIQLPGYGQAGANAPGEVLVSLTPGLLIEPALTGPSWGGPGNPASVTVNIPIDCSLAGISLWLQGIIVDPFGVNTFGLTEGRRLDIAN